MTDYNSYYDYDPPERYKGNRLRKFVDDYTLFDIETTGLKATCEIIEISAAKVRKNEIIDTFDSLVKPTELIPDFITRLTGITNEMVADAQPIEDVLPPFIDFIGNDILIGHNINTFDLNHIYDKAFELLNMHVINDFIDTYDLAHCLSGLDVANYKLGTLCQALKVTNEHSHRALSDVIANHQCYQKMKSFNIVSYKHNPKYECKFTCANDMIGKRVCLTGDFTSGNREQVKERLTQLGVRVVGRLSSKTNYLLIGNLGTTTTHKIDDAKKLGIQIVYEKDFIIETEVLENV